MRGPVAQQLSPVTNTVRVGCPGFSSLLWHAILSQHVVSVYTAGCLATIALAAGCIKHQISPISPFLIYLHQQFGFPDLYCSHSLYKLRRIFFKHAILYPGYSQKDNKRTVVPPCGVSPCWPHRCPVSLFLWSLCCAKWTYKTTWK